MKFREIGIVLCLAIIAALGAHAATPPDAINYQAVLRDASGQPLDGSFDMVFRFWSAETAGDEILVDTHDAINGNPIAVTEGLLSVKLGTGVVADGSGAGIYTSLLDVFRDYSGVWLAVEVDGEVLSPRVQVVSSGHALNAQNAELAQNANALGGLAATSFLTDDASTEVKAGELWASAFQAQGNEFRLGNGSRWFEEDGNTDVLSSSTFADLSLRAGAGTSNRIDLGSGVDVLTNNGFTITDSVSNDVFASLDNLATWEVEGDLSARGGDVLLGTGVRAGVRNDPFSDRVILGFEGFDSSDGRVSIDRGTAVNIAFNDRLSFLGPTAVIRGRMDSEGSLGLAGTLQVGNGVPSTSIGYSRFGFGTAEGGTVTNSSDLLVSSSLEVENLIYVNTGIVFNEDGPDGLKQQLRFFEGVEDGERFQWDGATDSKRFEASDDLRIFGALIADTKNFVQNHPEREDLQIVYTSLEGDESTVFTRGFARLEGGRAVIALGETFRHVANPDIGLSAHLTPRGEWAELFVESLSPTTLVVRAAPGAPGDVVFDYLVMGLRVGYESFPVLQPKSDEAFLPLASDHAGMIAGLPEAERATALARYQSMHGAAHGAPAPMTNTPVLKEAIGQRPQGLVFERGSAVAVRDLPAEIKAQQVGAESEELEREASRSFAGRLRETSGDVERPAREAPSGEAGLVASAVSPQPLHAERLHVGAGELTRVVRVSEAVEAGDVLAIDPQERGAMRRARQAESALVFGIVAADPGLLLGSDESAAAAEAGDGTTPSEAPVALAGVVRCKVDASFGPIQPGDLLVASANPGHAMRVADPLPGTVLGKALEPLGDGVGTIEVLVMTR